MIQRHVSSSRRSFLYGVGLGAAGLFLHASAGLATGRPHRDDCMPPLQADPNDPDGACIDPTAPAATPVPAQQQAAPTRVIHPEDLSFRKIAPSDFGNDPNRIAEYERQQRVVVAPWLARVYTNLWKLAPQTAGPIVDQTLASNKIAAERYTAIEIALMTLATTSIAAPDMSSYDGLYLPLFTGYTLVGSPDNSLAIKENPVEERITQPAYKSEGQYALGQVLANIRGGLTLKEILSGIANIQMPIDIYPLWKQKVISNYRYDKSTGVANIGELGYDGRRILKNTLDDERCKVAILGDNYDFALDAFSEGVSNGAINGFDESAFFKKLDSERRELRSAFPDKAAFQLEWDLYLAQLQGFNGITRDSMQKFLTTGR